MKRAHVIIEGKVQGVFFRDHTQAKANSLGINGWVRNNPDGTVEAIFEGDENRIKKIIEWCKEGSPEALVKNININWEEPEGENNFVVL